MFLQSLQTPEGWLLMQVHITGWNDELICLLLQFTIFCMQETDSPIQTKINITSTCFSICHMVACTSHPWIACNLKVIPFLPLPCYLTSTFRSPRKGFILLMFSGTDLICCAILQALPPPSSWGTQCSIMSQWHTLSDGACVSVNATFSNDPNDVVHVCTTQWLF